MFVSKLFSRQPATQSKTPQAPASGARPFLGSVDAAPGDVFDGTPGTNATSSGLKREPSGSWLGALVGGLARLPKAAAGALLGAVALTTIATSGAALAAEPTAQQVTPQAVVQTVASQVHLVESGDNLWSIAQSHGLTLRAVVAANPQITDPGLIRPGDRVHLSTAPAKAPDKVKVAAGDTMWRLAGKHSVDLPAFIAANPQVANPGLIQPGQTLFLPTLSVTTQGVIRPLSKAATNPPTKPGTPGVVNNPTVVNRGPPVAASSVSKKKASGLSRATGKLWQKVRKLAFKLVTDKEIDSTKEFEFGEGMKMGVALKGLFSESSWGNWNRMSFDRAQDKSKEVLWVDTQGSAYLSGAHKSEAFNADAKLEFGYSLVRPHVFSKKDPDPVDAAEALVNNFYRLPMTAKAAAKLEQGSAFALRADAELGADGKISLASVDANVKADISVAVERRDGHKVLVSLERGAVFDSKLQARDLADGNVDVDAGFGMSRQRAHTYSLDLSTVGGKEAYNRLLSLRGKLAAELANTAGSGVQLIDSDVSKHLEVDAEVKQQVNEDLGVTIEGSWQRSDDATDGRDTESRLGAAVKYAPIDSGLEVGLQGAVERSEDEDQREIKRSGALAADKELSPLTDIGLKASVGQEHRVDHRWNQEVRSGQLAGGGNLSTQLLSETGSPIKLGFDANLELRYQLTTPKDVKVELPLDALTMQKAPKGTRMFLRGTGTLGIDLERKVGDFTLGAEGKRTGDVQIEALRGTADNVSVTVDFERLRTTQAALGFDAGLEEGSLSASFQQETKKTGVRTASFEFSLDKAKDRGAYEALLRGNIGPASRLAAQTIPQWVDALNRTQTIEAEYDHGDWVSGGIKVVRRDLDPTDGRVAWDNDRSSFTASEQAKGKTVRWIETEGVVAPKLSFSASAPIGGAVTAKHGFSATKTMRYRVLGPSLNGVDGAMSPALKTEDALALPRGSEFELAGRGRLTGFAGLGFGAEWGTAGVTAGATAGAETKRETGRTWKVSVKRLEGQTVELGLTRGSDRNNIFEIAARVGVVVNSEELLGLETAVEQIALLGKLTDKLDGELKKRLSAEFEASWNKKTSKSRQLTFQLDLAQPQAKAVYEDLVGLDGAQALRSAKIEGSGVKLTRVREDNAVERGQKLHLDVFGERLFLTDALRVDSTTIDAMGSSSERTDRSTFKEVNEGLFGRDQTVRWEAVRVRTDDDQVGKGYYRLQYSDKDPLTSKDEVKRLMALGHDLAAENVRAPRVEKGARGLKKLLGRFARHGSTKLEMDLFFTGAGIDAIRGHNGAQALTNYGQAAARNAGEGPYGWVDPAKTTKATALLDKYLESEDEIGQDRDSADRQRSTEVEYWRLTGRDMWKDRPAYVAARGFAELVEKMHNSTDPVVWNRAFADMGEALSFDFYDAVSAMQAMSPKAEILVHNLQMKGRAVDIEMKDEGLLRHPG